MPAPGDQHNSSVANPFDEVLPRVSEYTAQQIATLQSRLERQLGPEYISSRAGPSGQRVHYVAAEKCIALANDIFGFNGWSSSIQNVTMDFVDEHPETLRVSLGLSVIVRVTLRDGTYHEDLGYGHIENCKGKAAAFEKAKKEGTTDALKRALRNFGNVLGNCLYDKDYLGKVTKIKVPPTKFNESNLHRHPDYVKREVKEEVKEKVKEEVKPPAPLKQEPSGVGEVELFSDDFGDLDDADFAIAEEGHPDEVVLGNTTNSSATAPQSRPSAPAPVNKPPQTPNAPRNVGPAPGPGPRPAPTMATRPQGPQQQHPLPPHRRPDSPALTTPNTSGNRPPGPGPTEPVGFFSARAINKDPTQAGLADGLVPKAQQMFNPKAESPSIRRTPGIDHNVTTAIPRSALAPQGSQSGPITGPGPGPRPQPGFQAGRGNVVNPHLDPTRRIGAPGGGGSPLANRGQYRPPTMKRPLPGEGPAAGRPALAETTNSGPVGAIQGANQNGIDVKRQRTT